MPDYVGPYSLDYYNQSIADQYYMDYEPSWRDLIAQGIDAASRAYQIGEAGYPPGSTIVYSPTTQYPGQTTQQPYPSPLPPGMAPQTQPSGGGVQLSNTTLMLLVGGVLLFILGRRK